MNIRTEVMRRGPAHFDCVGRFLDYPLIQQKETITEGLAKRLVKHAVERLACSGFAPFDEVLVYTMDGDDRKSDRSYSVEFTNAKGGSITVCRILLRKGGHPFIDHGLDIEG